MFSRLFLPQKHEVPAGGSGGGGRGGGGRGGGRDGLSQKGTNGPYPKSLPDSETWRTGAAPASSLGPKMAHTRP